MIKRALLTKNHDKINHKAIYWPIIRSQYRSLRPINSKLTIYMTENQKVTLGIIRLFYKTLIIILSIMAVLYLKDIKDMLSDSRAIQSEARDTLNVITCYQLNKSVEGFNSCMADDINSQAWIKNK